MKYFINNIQLLLEIGLVGEKIGLVGQDVRGKEQDVALGRMGVLGYRIGGRD